VPVGLGRPADRRGADSITSGVNSVAMMVMFTSIASIDAQGVVERSVPGTRVYL
jgi:hypothetical protein